MNNLSKILTTILIISGIVFLQSCVKEKFSEPPVVIPTVNFSSNCTIAGLKLMDPGAATPVLLVGDTIIKGIVIGTDESGNFYKQLFIEDSTAGLEISLDNTNLYTSYRLGQVIYIKCHGLYLGEYGGKVQLGYLSGNAIGRIPAALISAHLYPDGLPGPVPAPVEKSDFSFATTDLDMLIKVDSVTFEDLGDPFSITTATTSRNIFDKNGNPLVLRTSNYANFASTSMPGGTGSITGILGFYSTYQFAIRDLNDLSGFNWASTTIFSEDFSTPNSLGNFTQYSVSGAQLWAQATFSSTNYATISGYSGGNNPNENWLISSPIDFDLYKDEKITFFTTMNYGTPGDGSLKIYYSNNYSSGNPNLVNWTEITGANLSAGGWVQTGSGNIDISSASGTNVRVAFKYTSTSSSSATWEVGGVRIIGTKL